MSWALDAPLKSLINSVSLEMLCGAGLQAIGKCKRGKRTGGVGPAITPLALPSLSHFSAAPQLRSEFSIESPKLVAHVAVIPRISCHGSASFAHIYE